MWWLKCDVIGINVDLQCTVVSIDIVLNLISNYVGTDIKLSYEARVNQFKLEWSLSRCISRWGCDSETQYLTSKVGNVIRLKCEQACLWVKRRLCSAFLVVAQIYYRIKTHRARVRYLTRWGLHLERNRTESNRISSVIVCLWTCCIPLIQWICEFWGGTFGVVLFDILAYIYIEAIEEQSDCHSK